MRISDWSSDVCSSDLLHALAVCAWSGSHHFHPAPHLDRRAGSVSAAALFLAAASVDDAGARRGRGPLSGAQCADPATFPVDRKSVVSGKSVSGRVDLGWRGIIKKKKERDKIDK